MRHAESDIQQTCVAWFRWQYPKYSKLLFAVPNGGARSAVEASIMSGEGVLAGVADVLLLVPSRKYHGLCIEFKRQAYKAVDGKLKLAKTYQRSDQKIWQEAVEAQGYRYAVIRTLEEFINLINSYLNDLI